MLVNILAMYNKNPIANYRIIFTKIVTYVATHYSQFYVSILGSGLVKA